MPRPDAANPPRHTSSGAIRPAGLAAATLTAAAVFILGVLILPPIAPEEPPPPPPPPPAPVAPPPPPPPPPPPAVDASGETPHPDATAAPAPAPAEKAAEAPAASAPATPPPAPTAATTKGKPAARTPDAGAAASTASTLAEAKPEPAKPEAAEPKSTSSSREKSPDKEVAREAWRKNLPDITTEAGKSAILIPIKGSIDGSTYHVTAKPKSVLVTLPKGESMITMPFYNLRRDGYRQLWIKKDDATGTTTIRIVLGEASDPQVEIKEDFVRVVVRRPADAAPSAPAAPESAAPAAAEPPVAAPNPARD